MERFEGFLSVFFEVYGGFLNVLSVLSGALRWDLLKKKKTEDIRRSFQSIGINIHVRWVFLTVFDGSGGCSSCFAGFTKRSAQHLKVRFFFWYS